MTARAASVAKGHHTGRRLRPGVRIALYTALIVTSIVMVGPFYWTFATSFKLAGDVFASPPKLVPNPWTLQNYRDVFTLLPFQRYFINSVIVTAAIVGLNVVFDTAAAYAFAKLRFPGRNVLFFMLLMTLMVPFQVNLIPLYRIMVLLHGVSPALGVDTYSGIVLPGMIQVFGIFLMRQFLASIPDEVLESARVDGASEFRILRSVIFPIAKPGMATLAIFTFLGRMERLPVAEHRDQHRLDANDAGRVGVARLPQHDQRRSDDGGHGPGGGADDRDLPADAAAVHRGTDGRAR